jgi:hypothetical protein
MQAQNGCNPHYGSSYTLSSEYTDDRSTTRTKTSLTKNDKLGRGLKQFPISPGRCFRMHETLIGRYRGCQHVLGLLRVRKCVRFFLFIYSSRNPAKTGLFEKSHFCHEPSLVKHSCFVNIVLCHFCKTFEIKKR